MNPQNCFARSNPNPLAPAWRFPSEWLYNVPAGYRDEYQLYTISQALTAGQQLTADLKFDTAGQCNFYWTHVGVFLFGGAGTPSVRLRDSEGFMFTNTRIQLANDAPFGRQDHMSPIFVAHRVVPGSILSLDLNETSGAAGVTLVFLVQGFKRWLQDASIDWRGGVLGPAVANGAASTGGL